MADAAPVLIWTSGLDRKCTWFNRRWLEFTGRPLEAELGDGWTEGVHPDDLARCFAVYTSHFDRREDFAMDYRLRRADGEWRWILDSGTPLRDEKGEFQGFVGSCVDIHERKLAEEALRQEIVDRRRREANQALLSAMADDFARLSAEEEITRAIGARLAAHLDVTTCSVADFADGMATVRSAFTRLGAVPAPAQLRVSDYLDEELQALARAGRTIVLRDMRRDPRVDANRYEALGVRSGIVVPFRRHGEWRHSFAVGSPDPRDWRDDEIQLLEDVAGRYFPRIERARAEEALRQSNEDLRAARSRLEEADRRKNRFLAVLSHELRNPLAPVTSGLRVLGRAPPGSVEARRATEVISRQIDQLAHLVDDLLDATRIERGKVQLRRGRVELNELVRRTFEDHAAVFDEAGVEARLSVEPDELFIDADRTRVAQIASNLLLNAAKFTPRGGRVTVTVEAEPSTHQAVLRVEDTGEGMSGEVMAHLFEPFMQADPSLDRSRGGLGLGLALVKGLVELHGGSVEARSEGQDRGSTFTVRLPLELSPRDTRAGHLPAPRPALRVLVIEDNADAAESLRDLLSLDGHEVAVATTGPDGLERARQFRPDVVLCDIGLPGMDGYAVARAFRADASLRSARLVALTGYALPDDVVRAAQAGFDLHLAKPSSLERLAGALAGSPG